VNDDPRAALLTAAEGEDGPHTALLVLRHALAWSARAVASAQPREHTDPAVIELVIALDDALAEVDALVEHVVSVADAGVAGVPVTEYLARQASALTELAARVASVRREHEALFAVEEELRACGEEHDRIAAQVEELNRLGRLSEALPEMREQHEVLQRRLQAMTSESAEAEQALVATAHQVVVLRQELVADLDGRTGEQLERLRRIEAEWAKLHQEYTARTTALADKNAEYEKLRAERDGLLRAVAAQQECDRDLLTRLSAVSEGGALDRVRALLSDVQTKLDHVESALGDALVRYDQFVEQNREVLRW
jgi:chromosome segregation ATPase